MNERNNSNKTRTWSLQESFMSKTSTAFILFFIFPCVMKSTYFLRSCHFLSQGLQVRCRVSRSSSVGTWAAAVLWLSFRMRWMWNDSLSDADCCTSLISYPCKQMLVSHGGISPWQKQHEDLRRGVWAWRIRRAHKCNGDACSIEVKYSKRSWLKHQYCKCFMAVSLNCVHYNMDAQTFMMRRHEQSSLFREHF